MIDGRGKFMIEKGRETRRKIAAYIKANPDDLRIDICRALDISAMTLRGHLKAISAQEK